MGQDYSNTVHLTNVSVMDIKTIFRNLVTNHYMPDFQYGSRSLLSFQTLFHTTKYSYCCCTCAFEHEYLDYITDSGEIDEEMYKRVAQCILVGKCPHVDEAPKDYIVESGICGVHVAAAVGTEEVLDDYRVQSSFKRTRIFKLDPYAIVFIKNSVTTASMHSIVKFNHSPFSLYAERKGNLKDNRVIHMFNSEPAELIVLKGRLELLKMYLNVPERKFNLYSLAEAVRLTFQHKQLEKQEYFLQPDILSQFHREIARICADFAMVYNEPEALKKLIRHIKSVPVKVGYHKPLSFTAFPILSREECNDILFKNEIIPEKLTMKLLSEEGFPHLLNILEGEITRNEIVDRLNRIPGFSEVKLSLHWVELNWTTLHCSLARWQDKEAAILKTLLRLGADVNSTTSSAKYVEMTPLCSLLQHEVYLYFPCIRQIAEMLIYENPDLDLHASVVIDCVKKLPDLHTLHERQPEWSGDIIMDTREHGRNGHDKENFVFNFMVPCLIECGFPASRDTVRAIMADSWKEKIHPIVYEYLEHWLDTPRSLMLSCRDVLRKHFQGRSLHIFVAESAIPRSLKDFLLLKPLLKSAPRDLLD